jgi:hypothetical protein
MRGILDVFREVRERSAHAEYTEFHKREWKTISDALDSKRNARFQVCNDDQELRATKDFPNIGNPKEVFVSFGRISSYWLSAIVRDPKNFPKSMVNIVQFLYNSPKSNWTRTQKQRWGKRRQRPCCLTNKYIILFSFATFTCFSAQNKYIFLSKKPPTQPVS